MKKYILLSTILLILLTSCTQDLSSKLKQELNVVEQKILVGMEMDEETQKMSDYALQQGYGSVKSVEELTKEDGTKIITAKLEKENTFLVKTTGPAGNETFIQEVEEQNSHIIVTKITEQGTIKIDLTTKEVIQVE